MESLPVEIAALVAQFGLQTKDLKSLALTSHRVNSLVTGPLYASANVKHTNIFRLLRTVLENPGLASLVSKVIVNIPPPPHDTSHSRNLRIGSSAAAKRVHRSINDSAERVPKKFQRTFLDMQPANTTEKLVLSLLFLLPRLRSLNVKAPRTGEIFMCVYEGCLAWTYFMRLLNNTLANPLEGADEANHQGLPLLNLEHLSISIPHEGRTSELSTSEFWPLVKLEGLFNSRTNLRSLELDRCHGFLGFNESTRPEIVDTLNLERLSLTRCAILASELKTLMQMIRCLKHFTLHSATTKQIFKIRKAKGLSKEDVSPAVLLAELAPHKANLRSLEFSTITTNLLWHRQGMLAHGFPHDLFGQHHLPALSQINANCGAAKADLIQSISLHDFSSLEYLNITAVDILGPMILDSPTPKTLLRQILPASLKRLYLCYANYFDDCNPQFITQGWRRPDDDWYVAYMDHMTAFLSDVPEHFPHLKEVCMELGEAWPFITPLYKEIQRNADALGVELVFRGRSEVESDWYEWLLRDAEDWPLD